MEGPIHSLLMAQDEALTLNTTKNWGIDIHQDKPHNKNVHTQTSAAHTSAEVLSFLSFYSFQILVKPLPPFSLGKTWASSDFQMLQLQLGPSHTSDLSTRQ